MPVKCFDPDFEGSHGHIVDAKVAGYAVTSTAPYNIDDKVLPESAVSNSPAQAEMGIQAIARHLHNIKNDPTISEPPQLVISVHGYNTAEKGIKEWYNDIFRYAAYKDDKISGKSNLVFVGYRWSSEQISRGFVPLYGNLRALPDVPKAILTIGLVLLVFGIGDMVLEVARSLQLVSSPSFLIRFLDTVMSAMSGNEIGPFGRIVQAAFIISSKLLFGLALIVPFAIAVLLLLRLSVYFRDVYRAINFAVPDLTELIRQIDKAVYDLEKNEPSTVYAVPIDALASDKCSDIADCKRVTLSFVGHSMGGLVITNVVRILSDVFDHGSIAQNPSSKIGNTLRLGRLILASPDIPVLSVVSSRANGLASSLRRFDEAYLFSSEGDLALKLASTAANYISFPSARQDHGHRLGSVALRDDRYGKGIINLDNLNKYYTPEKSLYDAVREDPWDILQRLVTGVRKGKGGDRFQTLEALFAHEHQTESRATLADLFTFFDCTDYQDNVVILTEGGMNKTSENVDGVLTRPRKNKGKREFLSLQDYAGLLFDMITGKRDVHGGYFRGKYSRELVYRLAFLGFSGMLEATQEEQVLESKKAALGAFNQRCFERGIQVYLSPLRYRVDVQGAKLKEAKSQMIQTVKAAQEEPQTLHKEQVFSRAKVQANEAIATPLESVSSVG